jgi:hypothetical protein
MCKGILALLLVWCACIRLMLELQSLFALMPAVVLSVFACAWACQDGPSARGSAIIGKKIYINGEYRCTLPPGGWIEIRGNDVYMNGKLFAAERR